jgi:hypothetical protein
MEYPQQVGERRHEQQLGCFVPKDEPHDVVTGKRQNGQPQVAKTQVTHNRREEDLFLEGIFRLTQHYDQQGTGK